MAGIVSGMVENNRAVLTYGLFVMSMTHMLTHVFTRVHTTLFPILQDEFNLSLQQLGLMAAIPPLCATFLALPAGMFSDRIGSKKLVLASLVIAILGSFLASRTVTPVMLIVAVSLIYINTTVYHPPAYSFVTRLFDPRGRLKALGIHGAGGTLGVAIGPISISILMGVLALGWRQVYLFWIIPLLLGVVAVLFIKSEPREDAWVNTHQEENGSQATSLLSVSLVMFLVYLGVRVIAVSMSQSFMALYLVDERGFSESLASLLIGINVLAGIIAAPLGGFLAVRHGEKRWLLTVLTLAYACFGLAIASPSNVVFVILYLAYGFGTYLGMAANSAIMARLSPGKQRGLAFALFFLPGSIVGAVAPLLAASIADALSLVTIFYVSTAIFFLSLGVLGLGVKVQPSR
jgi:MFS family permease